LRKGTRLTRQASTQSTHKRANCRQPSFVRGRLLRVQCKEGRTCSSNQTGRAELLSWVTDHCCQCCLCVQSLEWCLQFGRSSLFLGVVFWDCVLKYSVHLSCLVSCLPPFLPFLFHYLSFGHDFLPLSFRRRWTHVPPFLFSSLFLSFPLFSSPTIGFASNIITIIISTLTTASGLSPRPFLLSKRQDNCSSFLGVVGDGFF